MLDGITGILLALAAFMGAGTAFVKWVILPLRRGYFAAKEAVTTLRDQLSKNGGGSMLDKLDAVVKQLAEIREQQVEGRERNEDRHRENSLRLEQIGEQLEHVERRVETVEIRQEYGARLWALIPAVFNNEIQAAIREIVDENPPPKGQSS